MVERSLSLADQDVLVSRTSWSSCSSCGRRIDVGGRGIQKPCAHRPTVRALPEPSPIVPGLRRSPVINAAILIYRSEIVSSTLQNNVREKLARGEVVSSMLVRLVRGIEIARIAKTAGFDCFYIDLEHSSFSLESTSQICMAALSMGIAPFVRVPANTSEWVGRVLDGGAMGIIVPHASHADDACRAVAGAKFAPLGSRSIVSSLPHFEFRNPPPEQAARILNDATMVALALILVPSTATVPSLTSPISRARRTTCTNRSLSSFR